MINTQNLDGVRSDVAAAIGRTPETMETAQTLSAYLARLTSITGL